MFKAIIPCNLGGNGITNEIYVYGNDEEIEKIAENPFIYTFFGKDERFFTEGTSFSEGDGQFIRLVLKPGTSVSWKTGDIRVSIPEVQDFDVTMNRGEAVSAFIENLADASINKIVDYEKQQFIPVYKGKDLKKLNFKIHLRDREDYEEWKTNDTLGWFTYTGSTNTSGDSVSYMGFDEDDIYYQKKKVTETFLRMMVYNTVDRRTQKMLYTAKIYLNSNDLYGQYIQGVSNGVEDVLSTIETEFVCTHKYDYDNPTEGFYMHLFPSNLNDGEIGTVYLKFELNNAKYGYALPLVLFSDGFRNGYMSNTGSGVSVDMAKLYGDMYIPVTVRRDAERYVWEFENDDMDNSRDEGCTLTLNLYEPRVNGMDPEPVAN
jgi:hypothetical protein